MLNSIQARRIGHFNYDPPSPQMQNTVASAPPPGQGMSDDDLAYLQAMRASSRPESSENPIVGAFQKMANFVKENLPLVIGSVVALTATGTGIHLWRKNKSNKSTSSGKSSKNNNSPAKSPDKPTYIPASNGVPKTNKSSSGSNNAEKQISGADLKAQYDLVRDLEDALREQQQATSQAIVPESEKSGLVKWLFVAPANLALRGISYLPFGKDAIAAGRSLLTLPQKEMARRGKLTHLTFKQLKNELAKEQRKLERLVKANPEMAYEYEIGR